MELRDVIAFVYSWGLSIAAEANEELEGEESAVLVSDMRNIKSEHRHHVQVGVIPADE